MKAFVVEKYGKDGLHASEEPAPTVGRGDVLVQVRAASINPLDKMTRDGEFKRLTSATSRSGTRSSPDPATTGWERSPN